MKGKRLSLIISIALSFIITFIPSSSVLADITNISTQSTATLSTDSNQTASNQTASSDQYVKAEAVAKLKAATLVNTTYGATSVQYALIDNGEVVISGQSGVYRKDKSTALTNQHMYGIGSVSKMFTAAAVMQLVDQGKIKLDEPIKTYIPEFTMEDPRYKSITVRMLLNHSSGLMGSVYHNAFTYGEPAVDYDLLEVLKTSWLKADPGEFSVYCNDGFTLAEILVEKVSGVSFTEYIKENITGPLSLNNTKTPLDKFKRDLLTKTYLPGSESYLPTEALSVIGAGGIYSSAEDLCHFAELFMNNSSFDILSNSSVEAMEKPEYLNGLWPKDSQSMISYGLGWDSVSTYSFDKYGITALVKGGDTLLYHASLIVLPDENMAMAVLSSGGASTFNQLMAQEVLLAALQEKGTISEIKDSQPDAVTAATTMPGSMTQWEGIYAFTGGVLQASISDEGRLSLKTLLPYTYTQYFSYVSDGKFYTPDGSTSVSFVKESNGNTYLHVTGSAYYPGLGQVKDAGYQAQLITANPISKDLKTIWEKRDKKYFIINEVYNSQLYTLNSPFLKLNLLDELEGYFMNAKILDENTARATIKIPGIYGRDLESYEFYKVNGKEYLKSSGFVLISEDMITSLSTKSKFTCTIGTEGYAKWYKIDKNSANKKIKVTLPKASSFTVYNNSSCVYSSTISSSTTVTLPSSGYIVFAGDPNAKITVKYMN